jgi:crossover junction endodeoxyribonuclease RuvC
MRILGIDPGLGITGYGLVETKGRLHKLVEAGIIRSSSREALAARLSKIYNGIRGIIREFRPDVLVVEELYSHYKHPKTAILMGHVRGVVYLAANESGLPLTGYSATRVKKSIIGYGNASKERIKEMAGGRIKRR